METNYQGCDAEAMKRNLMKTKIILQLTVNISESLRANYINTYPDSLMNCL